MRNFSKVLVLLIIISNILTSCDSFKSDEEIAKANIEEKLIPSLRNPDSYKFIEIEPITERSEKKELESEILNEKYSLASLNNKIESTEKSADEWGDLAWEKRELEENLEKLERDYLLMFDSGNSWKQVIMHYRAENGFGGMSKGSVLAKLDEGLKVMDLEDVSDIYEGF